MWISAFAIVLALTILFFHRRYYVLQYMFFLRYPLLLATVLVLLPLTAHEAFDKPLRNLFVLERPSALALVTALALLVAWQVMYCAGVLYEHSPHRVKLRFRRGASDSWTNAVPRYLRFRLVRFSLFAILALPVIVVSARRSLVEAPENIDRGAAFMSAGDVVLGLVFGALFALVVTGLLGLLGPRRWLSWLAHWAVLFTAWADRLLFGSTTIETDRAAHEARTRSFIFRTEIVFLFALVTFLVYLALGALGPVEGALLSRFDIPVMVYVLLLMMLVAWILCWFSFLFDRHRLLPELIIVPLIAISYTVFGTDHFYAVEWKPGGSQTESRCPTAAVLGDTESVLTTVPGEQLQSRWRWSGLGARPVIVATSGGGITAAYWTTVVLTQLERAVTIPGDAGFSDLVVLVSGTSGGSVGSLYYVDAYEAKRRGPRPFTVDELQRIQQGAGASSLNAVGWGLAYRDFWRVVFPPLVAREADRASTMETRWRQGLLPNRRRWDVIDPPQPATVHDPSFGEWAEGVREGWRPAAVFNATLVETGELLQIANVALPPPSRDASGAPEEEEDLPPRERSFADLFPGADIKAVTAARLSATFPWVTPTARPDLNDACSDLYHVADGGYYDNYGVLSALAYAADLPEGTRPILVEIRASNSLARAEPELERGFALATIGPLLTLLAVRTTSQLARNEERVTREESAHELDRVVFELREEAPLSWHLSPREREKIEAGWQACHVQKSLRELCRMLGASCAAP